MGLGVPRGRHPFLLLLQAKDHIHSSFQEHRRRIGDTDQGKPGRYHRVRLGLRAADDRRWRELGRSACRGSNGDMPVFSAAIYRGPDQIQSPRIKPDVSATSIPIPIPIIFSGGLL
jgi:hypothetical protein